MSLDYSIFCLLFVIRSSSVMMGNKRTRWRNVFERNSLSTRFLALFLGHNIISHGQKQACIDLWLTDGRPSILITMVNIRSIYTVGGSGARGSNSSVKSSVELLGLDTAPIVLLLCRGSSSGWKCRLTSLTAPLRSTVAFVGASMVSSKIGCTQGLDW